MSRFSRIEVNNGSICFCTHSDYGLTVEHAIYFIEWAMDGFVCMLELHAIFQSTSESYISDLENVIDHLKFLFRYKRVLQIVQRLLVSVIKTI